MNDPESQPPEPAEGNLNHSLAPGLGLNTGGSCELILSPAMTINRGEFDAALDIVEAVIQR